MARRPRRWVLRAERHHLPVAVAVGQLLPRGGVGAPRRRARDRRAAPARCPPRTTTASSRTCATATGPIPHEALWGRRAVVDDHPAADVRARRRRAHPPRAMPPDDEVVERGAARARVPAPTAAAHRRRAWWRSATRGSRAATTARGGTTPCPAGARPRRGSTARGSWSRSIERAPSGAPLHNPAFAVGSVGFSALVAWNALELATRHRRRRPRAATPASWPVPSTRAGTPTA